MKHPARIVKYFPFSIFHFPFKKKEIKELLSKFRKWRTHLKYKLFLLDRKILCHPVLRFVYPQPGFARRFVAGMMAFIVLGVGLVVYYQPGKADAAWYSDTWKFRKLINIDSSMAPSTQTNFPVMIKITDPGLATNAQSTGADILFTDYTGTLKLSHEIEKYTSANGELIAWVEIPSLSSTADTNIYMYYGNASASDQQDRNGVWDGDYKMVYHLNDASGAAADDSTSNNKDAAQGTAGEQPTVGVSGKVDGAMDFDGTGDNFSVTSPDLPSATSDFTYETWVNLDTNTDEYIFQVLDSAAQLNELAINVNGSNKLFVELNNTSGFSTTTSVPTGSWTHIVVTRTSGTMRAYINGSQDATTDTDNHSLDFSSCNFLYIAADTDTTCQSSETNHLDGRMDEIRVSDIARSADWITTEYRNQNDPSTYISLGSKQEQKGAPVLYWNFDGGNGAILGDSSAQSNGGFGGNANPQDGGSCLFGGKCLKFTNNGGSSLFSDGLESGGTSNWTSVTSGIVVDTGTVLDGNYSVKVPIAGTNKTAYKDVTAQTAAYVRGYVYVASATTEFEFMSLYSTGGSKGFYLYRDSNGFLCIWNGVTSAGTCSSSMKVPIGEWHKYELYVSVSSSVGKIKVYVDGALVSDLDLSSQNTGTNSLDRGIIGDGNNSRTATYYIDNFSVDTAPFTYVKRDYRSDTELDPGTASFTTSAWFKHPSTVSGTDTLIARSNGAVNGIGYKVYMNSSGNVCFGIDDDATSFPDDDACSTSMYTDSYWHHVQAVKSGTTSITLYIDGKQVDQDGTLAATSTLSGSSPALYVGIDGDGTSNPWDGYIDEVKYFDYAKSPAQVKADYNAKGSVLGASAVFGGGDAATSVNQGLVGYWKMDDGVGNDCASGVNKACDSSGNGFVGTWTNQTASTSGKFGFATVYDGTNDYTSVSDNSALDFDADDSFTVSQWVNPSANGVSGTDMSLGKGAADTDAGYAFKLGSGVWRADISDGTNQVFGIFADGGSLNTWAHIVMVVDRKNQKMKIYLNGNLVDTEDISSISSLVNSQALTFGADFNQGSDYTGKIDETRIYNRSLSDREVRSLYDWAPGPVGYWKLDEHTGIIANDSSGIGNTGILTNSSAWTSGKYGGAVTFDGVDDVVNANSGGRLDDVPASGMTIEAWIKPRSLGETSKGRIIEKAASTNPDNGWLMYVQGTNTIAFEADFDGASNLFDYTADNSITMNAWNHVVVTWDGSTAHSNVTIYVNGVPSQGASPTNGAGSRVTDAAQDFRIGNSITVDRTFDGAIDDVRVYNYIRTPKQIVQDMNGGHPAVGTPIASPVGHWSFDEGYGTTANDKTPLDNDLTLSTALWINSGKFGKAWNGAGTNWLSRADDADFDFAAADDFSISTWFKSDSETNPSNTEFLVDKEAGIGYALYAKTNGLVCFGIDDDATWAAKDEVCSVADIYDKNWHHVVATKIDGKSLQIFVDGKLHVADGVITATGTLVNSDTLTIGGQDTSNGTDEFNGDIDETKIYRYALNADEVRTEYNQAKAINLGALSANVAGVATNSAARYYCPPGDGDGNCASSSDPSPVAHWTLDERTGTTINDKTNGFTGTLTSGSGGLPFWSSGKVGSGVGFKGGTEYISGPTSSILTPANDLTVETWVKFNSLDGADRKLIYQNNSAASYDYQIYVDGSNRLSFDWRNTTPTTYTLNWSGTLRTGVWYHVVALRTGTTLKFFVNGIEDSNTTTTTLSMVTANSTGLLIGGNSFAGNSVKGTLDDIKIYNYARSQAQIAWDYNRGRPTSWWKFDECTGTTLYDTAWTASGSATRVNGTLTNATAGTCEDNADTAWYNGRTGRFNSSLNFDGSDDVVEIKNDEKISMNQGLKNGFTISTWVNADSAGEGSVGQIFNKAANTYCRTENLVGNHLDLKCSLDLTTDATITVGNAFDTGGWHNVVLSWTDDSDDEISVWIDGKLRGTSNGGAGAHAAENNSLFIGGSSAAGATAFAGKIDHVMVFPYEMTSTMIRTLYNENSAVRIGPSSGKP